MNTPAEANVLRIQIEKLEAKVEKMKQLSNTSDFLKYYYSKLKDFDSNIACFNAVNEEYFNLFGKNRYSDYSTFRNAMHRFNKKK